MMNDQTPAIGIFRLFYLHSFVAIRNEPIPHLQFVHTEYVMCFSLALARSVYAYNTDKMCEMKLHTSKTFKQQWRQQRQRQQKQEKQKKFQASIHILVKYWLSSRFGKLCSR